MFFGRGIQKPTPPPTVLLREGEYPPRSPPPPPKRELGFFHQIMHSRNYELPVEPLLVSPTVKRKARNMAKMIELPHTLPTLAVVNISIPRVMSPEEFDSFIGFIESIRDEIVETPERTHGDGKE